MQTMKANARGGGKEQNGTVGTGRCHKAAQAREHTGYEAA